MAAGRSFRAVALLATVLLFGLLRSATASACDDWPFAALEAAPQTNVEVPRALNQRPYPGIVIRPPLSQGSGKFPAVFLLHGKGAGECALWWAARYLANKGYVALVLSNPTQNERSEQYLALHEQATRRGVAFLRSSANPYADVTKQDDIGLVGHSLGAAAISEVQADLPAVKALVAFDSLRAGSTGDPGVVVACQHPYGPAWTARVPGLGEAGQDACSTEGQRHRRAPPALATPKDFTEKPYAFKRWHHQGVYTMQTVMKGFAHDSFAGPGPKTPRHATQLQRAGYYMLAWFDLWLKGQGDALNRLLDPEPMGVPIVDVLSGPMPPPYVAGVDPKDAYHSAAFLPSATPGGADYYCSDLLHCLSPPAPSLSPMAIPQQLAQSLASAARIRAGRERAAVGYGEMSP